MSYDAAITLCLFALRNAIGWASVCLDKLPEKRKNSSKLANAMLDQDENLLKTTISKIEQLQENLSRVR